LRFQLFDTGRLTATWAFSGILAGWVHGAADYLTTSVSLPDSLFGPVERIELWAVITAVPTMVCAAIGLVSGIVLAIALLATHSRVFSGIVLGIALSIPVWLLNRNLLLTSPAVFFVTLVPGTLIAAAGCVAVVPDRACARNSGAFAMAATLFIAVFALLSFVGNCMILPGLYQEQHSALAFASMGSTTVFLASIHGLAKARKGLIRSALLLTTVALWIVAFVFIPDGFRQVSRSMLFNSTVETSHALRLLGRATDWDGDGVSSLFSGPDCNNLDAEVHAGAVDIPDDGIDQDCLGGDSSSKKMEELFGTVSGKDRGSAPNFEPRSVIIISVDALRHDRAMMMRGYRELAERGTVFERAYVSYPSTILSFYSMVTGLAPSSIQLTRWIKWDIPRPDHSRTMPELLSDHGFRTHGLFFHHIFAPAHGLVRGFKSVWTESSDPDVVVWGTSSRETADRAIKFLEDAADVPEEPYFLWVHFYDPHEPYVEHVEVPVDDPSDDTKLYEAEIRYTDMHLSRLVDLLVDHRVIDHAYVIFTSDHGESLGDHGVRFHASNLYDEQLRVPLVFVGPGIPVGESRPTPVSLMGLSDTISELLYLPAPDGCPASSFASLLAAPAPSGQGSVRPIFAEVFAPRGTMRTALVWPWKLIYNVTNHHFELFDLERDPAELYNVFDIAVDKASMLQSLLGNWTSLVLR